MSDNNDRIVIQDLAWEIAQLQTDGNSGQWAKDNDADNKLRRTIAAAMTHHGYPEDGIPGVLPNIFRLIEKGEITARSTFNDLPPSGSSEVKANPANWYVSLEHADIVKAALGVKHAGAEQVEQFVVRGVSGTSTMNRAAYNDYLELLVRAH